MSNFYTLLTNIGAALHANAQVQQTTVAWSHFSLGDGNGAAVKPSQTQTGLHREVHRLAISSIEPHPDNPNWIVVEAVVPSDVGGWTVRESAIYGGPGGNTCIAVGNYPETYKPVLAEGAGREMVMRMIVEISSVATVKLQIDPAVAIASRQWVQSLVASPQKAGLVKLATPQEAQERERNDVAVTPLGLDAVMDVFEQTFQARFNALESRQKSLGDGQTWQNMTASRVGGTTYTNTTGRSIFVRIVVETSWAGTRALYVDGVAVDVQTIGSAINTAMTLLAIVPAGSTYSVIAASPAFTRWMELR